MFDSCLDDSVASKIQKIDKQKNTRGSGLEPGLHKSSKKQDWIVSPNNQVDLCFGVAKKN